VTLQARFAVLEHLSMKWRLPLTVGARERSAWSQRAQNVVWPSGILSPVDVISGESW
jgi:hypothetical protein